MDIQVFYQLKEIESLEKMIRQLQLSITEEKIRTDKLLQRDLEKKQIQDQLKNDISQNKKNQIDLEQKLTQRLNEETQRKLEDNLFNLMLVVESQEKEYEDGMTFLQGLQKSIHEITLEVNEQTTRLNQEITHYQHRIDNLKSQLPAEVVAVLNQLQKLHLAFGIFTANQDSACKFCRRKLSKLEENEIDIDLKIKTCASCQRLFLPYKVVS